MKNITQYLTESKEGFKTTQEWLEKMYKEYNEKLFNNELTKNMSLRIVDTNGMVKLGMGKNTIGLCAFDKKIQSLYDHNTRKYVMENGMYIMAYQFKRVTDIDTVGPFIAFNKDYDDKLNELQHEDTLIHEMIHHWVHRNCEMPKMAHGKEFKAKCKEVRELAQKIYGKKYWLTTYADVDAETPEETEQQELEAKMWRLNHSMRLWFIELKNGEKRFIWNRPKGYGSLMKRYITEAEGEENIKRLVLFMFCYKTAYNMYGHFSAKKEYKGYMPFSKYPKLEEWCEKKLTDTPDKSAYYFQRYIDETINEGKKPYIKPDMEVIELPKNINFSTVNLEELLNSVDDDIKVDTSKTDKDFVELSGK